MKALIHFLKLAWKTSPSYVLCMIAMALVNGAKTILNIVLPMLLVDELTGDRNLSSLLLYTCFIIGNNVLMQFIANLFRKYMDAKESWMTSSLISVMGTKVMNIEYSYLEDPYYLDLKERAIFSLTNQSVLSRVIYNFTLVIQNFCVLISLITILATLGWQLIVACIIASASIFGIYGLSMGKITKVFQMLIPVNRRFNYYLNLAIAKPAQKEIRLYDMESLITRTIRKDLEESMISFNECWAAQGQMFGGMAFVSEVISAFSYCWVGIRTLTTTYGPKLSLGALTMYVTSAINFSNVVSTFGEAIVSMNQMLHLMQPYLEFMNLPEETAQSGHEPFAGDIETVEFRDVTFTYPKTDRPILKNISFKVNKGEKISIVGLNGSGKSTLVKLICRMYQADSGEILVNGRNIYDYDYNSYMDAISAVFQDYKMFNFTIEENIAGGNAGTVSQERVQQLIDEVGLHDKVAELPKGVKSRFGKEYDEDGIEMSGGQSQKIAIARALYKKASMVILDEPASALDPISEAEIYEKFNSLVQDKTAMYISHRMSSSVFCDRILIIDGGTVADYDTHENLMKKTDSLYYKLFMAQADNYRL